MNFVYKTTTTILLISLMLGSLLALANWGYLDNGIKHAVKYYLNLKGYDSDIGDLKFNTGRLSINRLRIKENDSNILLDLEDVSGIFSIALTTLNLETKVDINRIIVSQNSEKNLISSSVKGQILLDKIIKPSLINITLSDIIMEGVDTYGGQAEFTFEQDNNKSNFLALINLNNSSFLHSKINIFNELSSAENSDRMSIYATSKNIPVSLISVASAIMPDTGVLDYLADSLSEGVITRGDIDIVLNDHYFKSGMLDNSRIFTKFSAENVTYSYDPQMPIVYHANLSGNTQGLITEINLTSASVANFQFPGARIVVDLEQGEKGVVKILGSGKGSVSGLTQFIPNDVMANLKKANIDLSKFTGDSTAELDIKIPFDKEVPNSFDIKAEIPDTNLSIFDDKVELRNAKLAGRLLDKDLEINGTGLINNLDSDIKFKCSVDSKYPFHQLTIDTSLDKNKFGNRKNSQRELGLIRYGTGKANLLIDYKSINNIGEFNISSDLIGVDLYIDKLGIHKEKGKAALLSAKGRLTEFDKYSFDFKVSGEQNLDIQGSLIHTNDTTNILIPDLKHKNNDLSVKIVQNNKNIDIDLSGKVIDLHKADLSNFMHKGNSLQDGKTNIRADIKEVKLKNDIWFDNLLIDLGCKSYGCFEGKMTADIGSRNVIVDLSSDGEIESWDIFSSNAGATLKALGMYDEMRGGTLNLNIKTAKQQVKPGKIIPIRQGTFSIEKFGLGNTPFLTRMISVVSLPGFIGMVTNNKDIIFSSMKGEFAFDKNIIEVSNSLAEGPFFSFSLKGNVDVMNRKVDIKGHVTPELYGFSSMVKTIPLFGKLIAGDKSGGGLLSKSYKINEGY